MRLSVLDQSTVISGLPATNAIQESLQLARHCETLGYSRYWLAEHHGSASQPGRHRAGNPHRSHHAAHPGG